MSKVFIDANVIANWILISSSANRLEELKDDKILSERFRAFSYSYVLIEALKEDNIYGAVTSTLALGEVYHVLLQRSALTEDVPLWNTSHVMVKIKEQK